MNFEVAESEHEQPLKLSEMRHANCYHCQQKYPYSKLRVFRQGEMRICDKCVRKRNMRNVKLKRRK